ncbi:site-specific integrase [Elizabethkingia anophelis]|uniref:site-specific integrase n=2 Tax=Elizabethkingia anophelis TaxID=1117645 RepID=UPI0021A4EAE9|nr:tyrosine-type recombinase/integrase [Elizabethkingia anophelis]
MQFKIYHTSSGNIKNLNMNILKENLSMKFKIPLSIPIHEWDNKKQRPKNIYLKKNKSLINKLDQIKIHINEYINQRIAQNKKISQRSTSAEIKKICEKRKVALKKDSLLFFMDLYIKNKKDLICHSTYKRYNVFFNLIKRFEGFTMKHLLLDDIDLEFVKKFFEFGKMEEYSDSTINRTIHFIKTILNFIERKGIRTNVRELEIRKEKQKKEVISLNEEEILRIKHTEFPPELRAAKQWLIISCYTGQRFSDFIEFSTEKIIEIKGKICIKFTQKKTGKEVLLPLHQIVINILKNNNNQFPEKINIQNYNQQIKKIAEIAGINQILKARKRIGYRVKNMLVEKWQTVTSHIGRRSFATNFYGKIPTPLLMEATGHSSEQMFLRYINPIDDQRIVSLSILFDKIYKQRQKLGT